ncbi:sugar phosphate isomerase/epimerase family protein [Caldanaerobius polysaccharolyticus]|uniref:sugar phosphate isomerase/epimerase family protein n=1 Tax=Caldanaerobius polysaccharolyticus TaxID=44256 RepID=UPI00047C53BB|nr:sugar phosphate isomerase/epimerase family protein [Caldanaerobius polysaccharolyticus]
MKKGINAWCFPQNYSLEECIKKAKIAGYDGIEINMTEFNKSKSVIDDLKLGENYGLTIESSEKEIKEILNISKDVGISIVGISTSLHWVYSLTSEDNAIRQKGIDIVKKMIDTAVLLETDAVLVVPGIVNETVSYKDAYNKSLKALKELRVKAEENKVYIGIENVWNKFLLSPIEMRNFIEEIGSPYVKSYFDVGNVMAFSYPEYWIEILSDYIIRVHVKDFDTSIGNIKGFKNIFQGDVDWIKVMKTLYKVKYDGYITAELSPYSIMPDFLVFDTSRHLDALLNLNSVINK